MSNKILNFYKADNGTRDFAILITVLFILLIVFAVWIATTPAPSNTYTMACKVVALDTDNDVVILVDYVSGNEWAWEGINGEGLGDTVMLIMNDSGTPNVIVDDVILSIK